MLIHFYKKVSQYHHDLGARTIWLVLALAVGIFVRGYFLSQPMRGDEAYTFLNYANNGFRALFEYSSPNNHVLNTLLIKVSTSLFGTSPASIRFPVFLAGLAAIILAFYMARSFETNKNSGILAAIANAVFPYLILYSTNARGYSLIVVLTLVIVFIGHGFSNNPSKAGMVLLVLFSALGMLAIPIMILPVMGIFFWIVCLMLVKKASFRTVLLRFAVPFGISSGLLTLAFYAPVIFVSGGVAPITSNKFVVSQNWNDFLIGLIPGLQKSFDELSRDIPPVVLFAIFILAALGILYAIKNHHWGAVLILPSLFLGALCVLLVQHTIPYPRTWIYIIPFILLLADGGLVFLLNHLPGRLQRSVNTILVLIGLFFAVNLISRNIITTYPDTSAFPEAPVAVEYLKPIFKQGDTLRISSTADWSVYFYFWYDGISQRLADQNHTTGRIFLITKKSRDLLDDAETQGFILLLDMGNMALYQGKR
jgi:hypothetical protein